MKDKDFGSFFELFGLCKNIYDLQRYIDKKLEKRIIPEIGVKRRKILRNLIALMLAITIISIVEYIKNLLFPMFSVVFDVMIDIFLDILNRD